MSKTKAKSLETMLDGKVVLIDFSNQMCWDLTEGWELVNVFQRPPAPTINTVIINSIQGIGYQCLKVAAYEADYAPQFESILLHMDLLYALFNVKNDDELYEKIKEAVYV